MQSAQKLGEKLVRREDAEERSLIDQPQMCKLENMKESKKAQRECKITVKRWDKPLLQVVLPEFAEASLVTDVMQIFKTVIYFCDGRPHVAVF